MQIKATLRLHHTLVRMAIIIDNSQDCGGCEERGILIDAGWECKMMQHPWQSVQTLQNTKKRYPAVSLLDTYPEDSASYHRDPWPPSLLLLCLPQ